jgi:hypothetical protein
MADLRLKGPSRRQLVTGAAALPLLPVVQTAIDPAIAACQTWLARQAERESLTRGWQKLETRLIREHNWFTLSRRERAAIPEAAELDAIDDRLDDLHTLNQDLLVALPGIPATTIRGLASKLAVAAGSVRPDENVEAHNLINSVLRDLQRAAGSA